MHKFKIVQEIIHSNVWSPFVMHVSRTVNEINFLVQTHTHTFGSSVNKILYNVHAMKRWCVFIARGRGGGHIYYMHMHMHAVNSRYLFALTRFDKLGVLTFLTRFVKQ